MQMHVRETIPRQLRITSRQGYDHFLGLYLDTGEHAVQRSDPTSIRRDKDNLPIFEVHSLRPCRRIGPDGQEKKDAVIEIVQQPAGVFRPGLPAPTWTRRRSPTRRPKTKVDFEFRGGCTLIIDQDTGKIRYCIYKPILRTTASGSNRSGYSVRAISATRSAGSTCPTTTPVTHSRSCMARC